MARTFVTSDDLTVQVELVSDPVEGTWRAYCAGCTPAYDPQDSGPDLLRESRSRFKFEDAADEAGGHADRCTTRRA